MKPISTSSTRADNQAPSGNHADTAAQLGAQVVRFPVPTKIKLNNRNLAAAEARGARIPKYDRNQRIGAALIGASAFGRSHALTYMNDLMNNGHRDWAVSCIGITRSDEGQKRADALREQDGLYTLTNYGADGEKSVEVIGVIQEVLQSREALDPVIQRLADPDVRVVFLTITEGGYKIGASGGLEMNNPGVRHDVQSGLGETPQVVYGYLLQAAMRRYAAEQRGEGPMNFTVFSCDNIPGNGTLTKRALVSFTRAWEAQHPDQTVPGGMTKWIEKNIRFPNSMVDRITPKTSSEKILELNNSSRIDDAIPLYSEDHRDWVFENDLADGRLPPFESVGVKIVDDIAAYQAAKMAILNQSHNILGQIGLLAGARDTIQAMQNKLIDNFLRQYIDKNVIPALDSNRADGPDLEHYRDTTLMRFKNPNMPDQLERIARNGKDKIPLHRADTIRHALVSALNNTAGGRDKIRKIAFTAAIYAKYQGGVDQRGKSFAVQDNLTAHQKNIAARRTRESLNIPPFQDLDLPGTPIFEDDYEYFRGVLEHEDGVTRALRLFQDVSEEFAAKKAA